ncbi:MAG: ABC transporter substrate-binding protein [Candidatus Methanoperedens sp.]|nr:ABC transporter substrate-binding protein [Candidatus Methanoperedens sp.]
MENEMENEMERTSDKMEKIGMKSSKRFILVIIVIAAILAVVLGLMFYQNQGYTGKTESITIGYSPFEQTALFWIAKDQHFFEANGLNVTLRKYDSGVGSLDGMLNGEADIAVGVTEFPTAWRILQKERIRIIGGIAKTEQIYLVGRKDRGIEYISDLKGKRVGTTLRTISHFYLGRFLELHGMNMKDITLVELKTPAEWVDAVANGDIDAVATSQPYVNSAKERLGDNAVIWPAQGGQLLFGLIVSTDEWVTKHPEPVTRLLKSLAQAEEYIIHNPAEAKVIVQKRLNMDSAYIETIWSQDQFSLSLDQSLILAMEDEARWMINNNLTDETNIPDFLDYIGEDGLKEVKPEAVDIVRQKT